jgi:altronate hydrolase
MVDAVIVRAGDSVATLLRDGDAGERIDTGDAILTLARDVPRGHKIALGSMALGMDVMKYGYPIGRTTDAIVAGDHVHSQNLATGLAGTLDYGFNPTADIPAVPQPAATFRGYVRADGRVGTRNEIWILPTVGCVARTAERIAAKAGARLAGKVDGVHAFSHPHGCSQLGHDLDGTRQILASLACHPNAGGVVIVGLGCEENQINALMDAIPAWRRPAIRTLTAQLSADEVEEGIVLVEELAGLATCERQEVGRQMRRIRRSVGPDREPTGRSDERPRRRCRRAGRVHRNPGDVRRGAGADEPRCGR